MQFFLMVSIIPVVIGLILLILSTIGRWKIFSSNGHAGILSLIPGVNFIVYGLIARRIKAVIGMIALSLLMSLTTAVIAAVNASPVSAAGVKEKASLLCMAVLGVLIILCIILYIRFLLGLCESLMLSKLFILLFLFFFPIAEIVLGFSSPSGIKEPSEGFITDGPKAMGGARTASLDPVIEDKYNDGYLDIWNSGAVIFPEDME